ncbi:MAG: ATPase P [Proteobacteria bacterium]|nr:ATPase P [Pseudomonadota bacterium]
MIDIDVPGFGRLQLSRLVCDFNGTLARDGRLLDELRDPIARLAKTIEVHVATADTFGTAKGELTGIPCDVVVLQGDDQALAKAALVERFGANSVVAVGNGRNDRLMLASAALGIGVIGDEGLAGDALAASDIVTRCATEALQLLLEPRRIIATLRD